MNATVQVQPSMLAYQALGRFFSMDPPNLPTRAERPLPCWVGASPPLSWRQRLSWLISALLGTVDIVEETARLRDENPRYDAWIAKRKILPRSQGDQLLSTVAEGKVWAVIVDRYS
jgi:hypothetical protein